MRKTWAALAIALAGCGSSGTPGGGGTICTEIGCTDQLSATLHDASGGLPSGKQVLTVTANGSTLTCTFTLPRPNGGAGAVTCPKGLTVVIAQAQSCTTSGSGSVQTQLCMPIAGKLDEQLTIVGSPTTVHVTQTVDGKTYLDETVSPKYTVTSPNGPTCEPMCSQASVDWTLAPP